MLYDKYQRKLAFKYPALLQRILLVGGETGVAEPLQNIELVDPKTPELQQVLNKYRNQPGALIPVLQEAQEVFGYLHRPVLQEIADSLRLPLAQVYGVVPFYAQFHLRPRGRNVIRVCQGTACHVRGGAEVLDKVMETLGIKAGETTEDLKFTLESVACIGACGLAPVMTINDDTYGRLTPDSAREILKRRD